MAAQIPPLLESYLALPPETSQLVLTGILGASTNWLVLRYLYSLCKPTTTTSHQDGGVLPKPEHVKVLLVSFMRDYTFWKENAGRLVFLPPPLPRAPQTVHPAKSPAYQSTVTRALT